MDTKSDTTPKDCENPDCFRLNEGRPEPAQLRPDGTCPECGKEGITWENIFWAKEIQTPTGARMLKCDGCSNIVPKAERFSSMTSEGYKVFARWCPDCVEVAKAGR